MRVQKEHLDGIVQLHRLPDPDERRAVFRQSMAALASIVAAHSRPAPLEGLSLEALQESLQPDEEWGKAWAAEVARRVKDLDEGRTRAIPAEEVFAKLRARFPPR